MGASWVDDDALRHPPPRACARSSPAPRPRRSAALQERVGELADEPLDPARPLWQFHLIEDYEGGSALVARIHHCIADGIALISVMMSIVDGGRAPPSARASAAADARGDWIADAVLKPLTDLTVKALGVSGDGVASSLEHAADPQQRRWLDRMAHGAHRRAGRRATWRRWR